jgi:hypothetical protein
MVSTKSFTRDDGRVLQVVEGYREHVLGERTTYSTRTDWGADQYAAAARKKLKRSQQFLKEFAHWGGRLEGARVIEVACGDGINSLLMALQPVESVTGIDLELPLVEQVERTERVRKLAAQICAMADLEGDLDTVLGRLPLRFINMNATAMDFEDASFDFLMSRSAMNTFFRSKRLLLRWHASCGREVCCTSVPTRIFLIEAAIRRRWWTFPGPMPGFQLTSTVASLRKAKARQRPRSAADAWKLSIPTRSASGRTKSRQTASRCWSRRSCLRNLPNRCWRPTQTSLRRCCPA